MNEQPNPHLYDQALEAQSDVPTSDELIDGWAEAEVQGDAERSDVYRKALEGHLEGSIEDGMISQGSLDDHIDAIHTAQGNRVKELKSKIEADSKAKELEDELPKDEFDGAYSSLGNRHTYLKTADGKSRQVSRAVALAKAENNNAELGYGDEPAAERFTQLRNELNKASERGVSEEKFLEIAGTLWNTARRLARQSGNTELMEVTKEHIIRTKNERESVLANKDQPVNDGNQWAAPETKDKISVKKLMEDSPKLDFHPTSDRSRAITQDEFKEFNREVSGADNAKRPENDTKNGDIFDADTIEKLENAAFDSAWGQHFGFRVKVEESMAIIREVINSARENGTINDANWPEAQKLIDDIIKSQKIRYEKYVAETRPTTEPQSSDTDELASGAPTDKDIDAIVAADEPGADEETRKKGFLAKVRLAGYSLGSLPFKISNRERRTGEPMSRRKKAGLALGGMAAVLGVAYVAHKTGVYDNEIVTSTQPNPNKSPGGNNLSDAADILSGNQSSDKSGTRGEVLDLISGDGQPEAPSQEAIQQVNETIANRTNEILNTPGELPWNRAESLYGKDDAMTRIEQAVDYLRANDVDAQLHGEGKTRYVEVNGETDTNIVWGYLSEAMAHQEMERFFENAKKNK